MKACITEITEHMTGNKELARVLNENFEKLNDLGHKREIAIFNRLNRIDKKISNLERTMNWKFDVLFNHFGIDSSGGPQLLTDSDQTEGSIDGNPT
jgi:hypothetical protein